MISLPSDVVVQLAVDELGLHVLKDLIATKEWNEYNFRLAIGRQYSGDAAEAVAEAYAWLKARAFVAPDPANLSDHGIFVTRTGRRVAAEGEDALHVHERLQVGLHPAIDRKVRRQFMLGEYEQGVFVAMKAVETRVRSLGSFPDDLVGLNLIKEAFRPEDGVLTDPNIPAAEREGLMALFRGAYAVLRNPVGHRDVSYDDPKEAAEAATVASLLMRILDRVQNRLGDGHG